MNNYRKFDRATVLVLFFILTMSIGICLFTTFGFFDSYRVSAGSLLAAFLTLTGFIFTARTFIVFKLNEVVYGNPNYQSMVAGRAKEGGYNKKLYDPLKKLDSKLSSTLHFCLITILFVIVIGFFPNYYTLKRPTEIDAKWVFEVLTVENIKLLHKKGIIIVTIGYHIWTSITLSIIFVNLCLVVQSVRSLDGNIAKIIEHWEYDYNNRKPEPDAEACSSNPIKCCCCSCLTRSANNQAEQ